jgi:iron complex transport system permease protein
MHIRLSLWILTVILVVLELVIGSVHLRISEVIDVLIGNSDSDMFREIVLQSRLPRILTSIASGAALSLSGLLIQTLFRNPLAGPSILGVTSGAALGTALVIMAGGAFIPQAFFLLGISAGAILGGLLILALVMWFAARGGSDAIVLIFGMMTSLICGAVVDIIIQQAHHQDLRSYVQWGFGSFGQTGYAGNLMLWTTLAFSIFVVISKARSMDALLTGETYAASMGVNVNSTRTWVVFTGGILAALVTACCGPVAFIGLVTPYLTRALMKSSLHRKITFPAMLIGANSALLCDLLSRMLVVPLNTVASLLGVPVVIGILLNQKNVNR